MFGLIKNLFRDPDEERWEADLQRKEARKEANVEAMRAYKTRLKGEVAELQTTVEGLKKSIDAQKKTINARNNWSGTSALRHEA